MPQRTTRLDAALVRPTLNVYLGARLVGQITALPSDRNIFTFDEDYLADPDRPTLSLGFKGTSGRIHYEPRPRQTKVDPYFSNLLPEGPLRSYVAEQDRVHPDREFELLRILGEDLPGAVVIRPAHVAPLQMDPMLPSGETEAAPPADAPIKFSLAGVQMKLSALRHARGGLTIPASGQGGNWIVKFPSEHFEAVPENEFWMLTLARRTGIPVPDFELVDPGRIKGMPPGIRTDRGRALAVRRFDRTERGRVHMEDFAQVFRIYPHGDRKYTRSNFDRVGFVIFNELGTDGLRDYVRRLVFTAAIGNGDMHVKNWSLTYPDGRTPELAPAYDYVSTLTYVSGDEDLGMNVAGTKSFRDVSESLFAAFANTINGPMSFVVRAAREMAAEILDAWAELRREAELPSMILEAIDRHMESLPLLRTIRAAR